MINRCLITVSSILRQSFSVWCALALGVPLLLIGTHSANADPLDVFQDCEVCPEMIQLPMGSFLMGAPEDEFRRNLVWRDGAFHPATPEHPHTKTDEGPQHLVTVNIPIAMGRHEITHDEWMACVNEGGCGEYAVRTEILKHGPVSGVSDVSGTHPVLYVSFLDAQLYIDWINQKLGINTYRLPTEAEWEYAARAGTTSRFAQGDTLTSEQAVFSGNMTEKVLLEKHPNLLTRGAPVPVGDLDAANIWGLRHMSGNVTEYTLSCYTKRYVGWQTTKTWLEKSYSENCQPVVRGGAFGYSMDSVRVAWRRPVLGTDHRTKFRGFRIVKRIGK